MKNTMRVLASLLFILSVAACAPVMGESASPEGEQAQGVEDTEDKLFQPGTASPEQYYPNYVNKKEAKRHRQSCRHDDDQTSKNNQEHQRPFHYNLPCEFFNP